MAWHGIMTTNPLFQTPPRTRTLSLSLSIKLSPLIKPSRTIHARVLLPLYPTADRMRGKRKLSFPRHVFTTTRERPKQMRVHTFPGYSEVFIILVFWNWTPVSRGNWWKGHVKSYDSCCVIPSWCFRGGGVVSGEDALDAGTP